MNKVNNLPATSRIWVYQSSRKFTQEEVLVLEKEVATFAKGWVSHNEALLADGAIYYDQFVVLMVDESLAGASGCSIDGSVKFIRQIQQQMGVDFFDRMTFAWKENDTVKTAHKTEFSELYKNGAINKETMVFDNLVATKGDFEKSWLKPLGESWHARMV